MSRKDNCWDNIMIESFYRTLKQVRFNSSDLKLQLHAYQIMKEYINWCNPLKVHFLLGSKSPTEFELKLKIKKTKKKQYKNRIEFIRQSTAKLNN